MERTPWCAIAALMGGALVVVFTILELGLRVVTPQIFPIHPRGMYVEDPHVGYVLAPSFEGVLERAEFTHLVTTNGLGLRGEPPRPRRSNTFRIVALGDSFTWGFGVPDDQTFPVLLEQRLAQRYPAVDVQVVNAGVPGYGTADALRFFQTRHDVLDPDLLVLTFMAENDFSENRDPALGRVWVEEGWLRAPFPPRPQPWRTLDWLKARSHLARLTSERVGYLATRTGLVPAETSATRVSEEDVQLTIDLLEQLARFAGERDVPVVFVFASSQTAVISEAEAPVPGSDVVAEAARLVGAGHVDLPPLLRARADRFELYYGRDGHWTATGNAAAAEILAAYLAEHHEDLVLARATAELAGGH